jgi:hypothetical protein
MKLRLSIDVHRPRRPDVGGVMPSTDPQRLLTCADRERLLTVNLTRPVRFVSKVNNYAHNVHAIEMPAHDLAAMSDIELVDLCDRSVSDHFGGSVERTSETIAIVKVWID